MSPRITHIDPEETIRKLKAKVDRLEKALAKQPAQQALDKMAENARELGIQMQPARPYRLLQDNGSKYFGESWDKAEQPAQQEPVAQYIGEGSEGSLVQLYDDVKKGTPLYTSPQPQRKPLDAGEISRLWKRHTNEDGQHAMPHEDDGLGFARAIEAAHGIKENT